MDQRQVNVLDFLLDDHFPLWDFADTFPDYRPEASGSSVESLMDLVRQGYVAVTFGRWFKNETVAISTQGAEVVLRNPNLWNPTGPEPGYVLELTDKGADYLRGLGIGLPDS